jgi:hypothetical protein
LAVPAAATALPPSTPTSSDVRAAGVTRFGRLQNLIYVQTDGAFILMNFERANKIHSLASLPATTLNQDEDMPGMQ